MRNCTGPVQRPNTRIRGTRRPWLSAAALFVALHISVATTAQVYPDGWLALVGPEGGTSAAVWSVERTTPGDAHWVSRRDAVPGTILAWSFDGHVVGRMVVLGERDLGPLSADTEYHWFDERIGAVLAAAEPGSVLLDLVRARRAPLVRSPASRVPTFTTPRRFRVATKPTTLISHRSARIFRVESDTERGLTHIVRIELVGGVPSVKWFVDATSHQMYHGRWMPDDAAWAVRLSDPAHLTSLDVATGYEMVPVPRAYASRLP